MNAATFLACTGRLYYQWCCGGKNSFFGTTTCLPMLVGKGRQALGRDLVSHSQVPDSPIKGEGTASSLSGSTTYHRGIGESGIRLNNGNLVYGLLLQIDAVSVSKLPLNPLMESCELQVSISVLHLPCNKAVGGERFQIQAKIDVSCKKKCTVLDETGWV